MLRDCETKTQIDQEQDTLWLKQQNLAKSFKSTKGKQLITYKGTPSVLTDFSDFSKEILQAIRESQPR